MIPLQNHITQLIIEVVANHTVMPVCSLNEQSPLIGSNRLLDSIGLVSMLVELETRLTDLSETPVRLMNDRAMSQSRSPFRSIGTLADYIFEMMKDTPAS